MEKELPELVVTDQEGYKSVAYDKMTAVLVEAIKEQQKLIEEQGVRSKQLEEERGEIAHLREMIKALQETVVVAEK